MYLLQEILKSFEGHLKAEGFVQVAFLCWAVHASSVRAL
jgi:hypothetical protein